MGRLAGRSCVSGASAQHPAAPPASDADLSAHATCPTAAALRMEPEAEKLIIESLNVNYVDTGAVGGRWSAWRARGSAV